MGEVGGDKGELGVHGGGGDVGALLEVVFVDGLSPALGDEAAEVQGSRGWSVEVVVFEDGEVVVGFAHSDGTGEGHVVEGLDELALLGERAAAVVAVDLEAEGAGTVLRP